MDTDVKSLKKAAKQGVGEELKKRVKNIITNKDIVINQSYKISWKNNPIGKIKKGKN